MVTLKGIKPDYWQRVIPKKRELITLICFLLLLKLHLLENSCALLLLKIGLYINVISTMLFLHGDLAEEVYMIPPHGYCTENDTRV